MMTPPNADQSFMQALMRRRMGEMQPGGSSTPPENMIAPTPSPTMPPQGGGMRSVVGPTPPMGPGAQVSPGTAPGAPPQGQPPVGQDPYAAALMARLGLSGGMRRPT